jgi:hypothetical protein
VYDMTKQPEGEGASEQLVLALPAKLSSSASDTVKVVSFVDAATLAVRREAIRRVRNAGIFAVPDGLERLKG